METSSSTLSVSTNPIGYSLGSTYLSSQDVLPSMNTVVSGVKYQLQQFFASPTAFETLNFVFGITDSERSQTPSAFDSLGQILIPQIQLLDDGVLSGAKGAYSAEHNTIYLAESLLNADSLLGQAVLLEEIGHSLDAILNPGGDTHGDEGELFANIVLGNSLSSADLARIQTEDDFGLITVNGQAVVVEQYNTVPSVGTPSDAAGNTLATARNLGALTGTSSFQDFVGSTDTNDYYRFTVAQASNFSLGLSGLTADADVQLLDSSGVVLQSSVVSGTTAESITRALSTGTYYVRVYPFGTANTNYSLTLTTSSNVDWFSQNLSDAGLITTARTLATDGNLSRNDMISLFRNVQDGSVIDATELTDLRTIVSNASRFTIQDSVRFFSNNIVDGNAANQWWTGGASTRQALGNLFAGSSSTQMERLIGKWFLGLDRPATSGYTYTNYSSTPLFQNGVSYQDVSQGQVGDCYFLASLGAVALRTPTAIQNMFIDNGDNTFTVRYYNAGVANYVTVDRYLPTSGGTSIYAQATTELWVALAEKAYAQINESGWLQRPFQQNGTNSYQGIEAGNGFVVLPQLTGRSANYVYDPAGIVDTNAIVTAFNQGKLITLGTKVSGVASNIVPSHEYVLLGYNATTSLFSVFNPWGVNGGSYDGLFKPGIVDLTASQLRASFDVWSSTV